jgi:hypothetical protein
VTVLPEFVERTPAERGFAAVFHHAIAPRLVELEAARRQQVLILSRRAGGFAVLCALWLAALAAAGGGWLWLPAPPLAVTGAFIAGQWFGPPGRDFADGLRTVILPPLLSFLGGLDHRRDGDLDRFFGRYQGVSFEIVAGAVPDTGRMVLAANGRRVGHLALGRPLFALPSRHQSLMTTVEADIHRLIERVDRLRREVEAATF